MLRHTLLIVSALLVLGGCSNTLVFMERTKVALSFDVLGNPVEPVDFNFGLKRTVLTLVPPKNPRSIWKSFLSKKSHSGEALSFFNSFDIEYYKNDENGCESPVGSCLRVKNAYAAGRAAEELVKCPRKVEAFFKWDDD